MRRPVPGNAGFPRATRLTSIAAVLRAPRGNTEVPCRTFIHKLWTTLWTPVSSGVHGGWPRRPAPDETARTDTVGSPARESGARERGEGSTAVSDHQADLGRVWEEVVQELSSGTLSPQQRAWMRVTRPIGLLDG